MQGGCVKHCSGRKAPLGISDQKTEKKKEYSRRQTGRSIPRVGREEAVPVILPLPLEARALGNDVRLMHA